MQFGGVASAHLDHDLAPFVRTSFLKLYKKGLKYVDRRKSKTWKGFMSLYTEKIRLTASIIAKANIFKDYSKMAYDYALELLDEEGLQSTQALYHNLNTLESRPGAQLPFTSINIGDDTSFEGRKVTEWCLKASIDGIGKHRSTPIFPISIFKYKKDVNDRPGTPNYDLKRLAIRSLCKRIYPNFVNGDWSMNNADVLPSQYTHQPELDGNSFITVRIGNKLYENITIKDFWNKVVHMKDIKNQSTILTKDLRYYNFESIDLRFLKTPVCIEDEGSSYKDYNLVLNEHMAKVNNLTKRGEEYGIGTDTFEFNLNGKHKGCKNFPKYDYDTEMATMGCRTLIGNDINGMGFKKTGRGNITPVTINLTKIGIKHGICLREREKADTDGFFEELDEVLELSEKALIDRFDYICSQDYRSGLFMYMNGTIADAEKSVDDSIAGIGNALYNSMCHSTNGIGYIGLANAMYAMFGKYHNQDKDVLDFAEQVVKHIYEYTKEATTRTNLNFTTYATPAENSCYTICKNLQKEYGKIPGVCDKDYLTNSHHVPVFEKISIHDKIDVESRFVTYPTAGCITYIELESSVIQNPIAVESIIDYAMANNIPYFAANFPIDNCEECGYSGEIVDTCPECYSSEIVRLRRVTGYLTTDFRKFNNGKIEECLDREKHSRYTPELQ